MKTPYPYQREAIDEVFGLYDAGKRRSLVVLPTGCGKTFTAARLALEWAERTAPARAAREQGFRVAFLAHREELVDQALDEFAESCPDWTRGRVQGASSQFGRDVTVGMIQTAFQDARLWRLKATTWDLIFVDEAHHSPGSTYQKVLAELVGPSTLLVGLTATPNRADGVGLHDTYDEIAYQYPIADAIGGGFLVDAEALTVALDLDLSKVRTQAGDFAQGGLTAIMNTSEVRGATLQAWNRYAPGRRTIGFATRVDHARALAEDFNAAGVRSGYVHGGLGTDDRRVLYDQLSRGELDVLWNVGVLTEGFNERSVDGILLARPTKSRGLLQQMLGRGLRTFPGKDRCVVVDVTGTLEDGSLVTVPMLGGLPGRMDLEPEAVREAAAAVVREERGPGDSKVQRIESLLAAMQAARSVDLLRVPRGRRFQWGQTPLGPALELGGVEAGVLVLRRHRPERDGRDTSGLWKLAHVYQVVQGQPPRVDVLADRLLQDDAIGLAETEAPRFAPARSARVVGPADPAYVAHLGRLIAQHEREQNEGRERPMDGASMPASPEAVRALRRWVRMTDAQAALLTRAEADRMLRQGRKGGGRRSVKLPPRLAALGVPSE